MSSGDQCGVPAGEWYPDLSRLTRVGVCRQLTSVVSREGEQDGSGVRPALGLAWATQLTTRLTTARTSFSRADRSVPAHTVHLELACVNISAAGFHTASADHELVVYNEILYVFRSTRLSYQMSVWLESDRAMLTDAFWCPLRSV